MYDATLQRDLRHISSLLQTMASNWIHWSLAARPRFRVHGRRTDVTSDYRDVASEPCLNSKYSLWRCSAGFA